MNIAKLWGNTAGRLPAIRVQQQFRFTMLSGVVLLVFLSLATGAMVILGTVVSEAPFLTAAEDGALLAATMVGAGVLIAVLPYWPVVLLGIVVLWGVVPILAGDIGSVTSSVSLSIAAIGLLVAPSFQIAHQWHKAVVLRLGRFKRVFGPGPHVILPLVDSIVRYVDMRIRVTDFSAEKSITRDTVPVHVDALAFWMVWDAEKALLEVENYVDAVRLSAQTALRDSIGRNDLATLLSERDRLGSEIQSTLDAKTNPWGITILSIEFKEVLIPKELEDALSKKAQAERERQSRVILSSAEVEIAKKFEEAAQTYERNDTAFQLRAMNMAYDSVRANKNIVLMPSSALESMNLGTTLGAAAFARRTREEDQYRDPPATDTSSSDGPEFRYGGRDQYRKPHGDANRGAKESGSSGQTKRDQPGGAHKPQRSSDKAQRSPSSDSTDDLPGGADQNQ